MAFRIFLDAGVLLDLTLKREGYAVARQLMELAVNGRIQAYVTAVVLQEAGRQLKRIYGAARAREILLAILAEVSVIDSGQNVAISALHSAMGDMDDVLSYYTALHHKLDYFISRDKGLQKAAIPVLPVYSPEEFLKSNQ